MRITFEKYVEIRKITQLYDVLGMSNRMLASLTGMPR